MVAFAFHVHCQVFFEEIMNSIVSLISSTASLLEYMKATDFFYINFVSCQFAENFSFNRFCLLGGGFRVFYESYHRQVVKL